MGNIGILTCKIITLEKIVPKFATVDYVHEPKP